MGKKIKNNSVIILIGCAIIICAAVVLMFSVLKSFDDKKANEENINSERLNKTTEVIPGGEMRGVWVASVGNINYPSQKGLSQGELQKELDDIVTLCLENSLNTVLFQVRPCCDALYNSSIFPSSVYLSGTQGQKPDGNFDSLEYLCEKAHENGIIVFAWINPLRVTTGVNTVLSSDNPASIHPEWCITYGDKIYFDPALEEVRNLVCDGIEEIVSGYSVDGIIFDDYFYPYPENGTEFDDSISYSLYANGKDKAQWRRDNVNALVKASYDTVKSCNESCLFGVSPFGIWLNNNGTNGGSDTKGLSAYSEIYCDALSWIEGGYVDFISPQIYWDFSSTAAPFQTLVDWWKTKTEGSGVALFISHAGYKASQWDKEEISKQIIYAKEKGCNGSIFYSYASLKQNDNGILQAIASVYDNSSSTE